MPRRFGLQKSRTILNLLLALGAALWVLCRPVAAEHGKVGRVIDGDTIELADGRKIRYIGVDTPEVRRREGSQWVKDPEPFGLEASAFNRQLVEGKSVRLELDVQTHDRYGRLLAYVYVAGADQKEIFVNAELVKQGMAQPLTIPPDVKYAALFRDLARQAREEKRGLWSEPKPGPKKRKDPKG